MSIAEPDANRRIAAALAAVALELAIGFALLFGLAVAIPDRRSADLATIDLTPQLPDPPSVPPAVPVRGPEGAASPPNLRARATEIVAPRPAFLLPLPTPVVAAPVAGPGPDSSAGAASIAGPGTGSGGEGAGTGSGGNGDGGGYGEEEGDYTPPRWLRGGLRESDYPAAAVDASGTVSVRFTVEADGRVDRCTITRSSGNAALDANTCSLIEQRYRYRPSLDPRGRPVRSLVEEDHEWVAEFERTPPPRRRDRGVIR